MVDNDWGSEGATGRIGKRGSAPTVDPAWKDRTKTPYDDDSKYWKDEYKRNVGESALEKQRERMRKTADEEAVKYEKKPAPKTEAPKAAKTETAKPAAGKPASKPAETKTDAAAAKKAAARRRRQASAKRKAQGKEQAQKLGEAKSKLASQREEEAGRRISMDESKTDTSAFKSKAPTVKQAPTVERAAEKGAPAKKRGLARRVASGVGRGLRATGRGLKRAFGNPPRKTATTAKSSSTGKRGFEGKWA